MLKDKAPLFLNITPSMPIGIYMMIPGNEYKPGDIVIYSPTVSSLDYFYKCNYEIPETDFIKEITPLLLKSNSEMYLAFSFTSFLALIIATP